MGVTFTTTVLQAPGMQATGLPVPDEAITALGGTKNPAVTVIVGDYRYPSTVSTRYGGYIVPLSAAHRSAIGVSAGDELTVTLELDTLPREIAVPDDLGAALDRATGARAAFDALAPSRRKAHITSVEGTKNAETRARRITAVLTALDAVDSASH